MKPKDGLMLGILLMLGGIFLLAFFNAAVNVYTMSEGSAYSFTTRTEYECGRFGRGSLCTIFSTLISGATYLLLFGGAVMVAVSIYKLFESSSVSALPPPPPRQGLCPKCGTMNPPTSKYCSECATKL